MTPEEFIAAWSVTKEELTLITGKSSETVKNWFSSGESSRKRPPTQDVLDRLAMVHLTWTLWKQQEEWLPPQIRSLFEIVKNRTSVKTG